MVMVAEKKYLVASVWFFSMLVLTIGLVLFQFHWGLWAEKLYFDGDNITLALVVQSWFANEPFRWVFSSQTFLFPEGPIYLLSYLITQDVRHSLLLACVLNFLLLIGLVYAIAKQLLGSQEQVWFVCTLFLILLCWALVLEAKPDVNRYTILSLVGLQTYYVGVVLVGLAQLWALTHLMRQTFSWSSTALFGLWAVCGALTYSSNPLYLLQFLCPLLAVGGWMGMSRLWRQHGIVLLCLVILTALLGLGTRALFVNYAIASVESYIHVDHIWLALQGLWSGMRQSINLPFLIWWCLGLALYSYCYFFAWHARIIALNATKQQSDQIVYVFLLVAPIIIVIGVLVSGNFYTRYWLPVPIFILLLSAFFLARMWRYKDQYLLGILITALVTTSLTWYQAHTYSSNEEQKKIEQSIACYQKISQQHVIQAVGGYWDIRYLNLYIIQPYPIIQVHSNFKPYQWLSNSVDSSTRMINTVIVSNQARPGSIGVEDVAILGQPSAIHNCPLFSIYIYTPTSAGAQVLNQRLKP